MNTRLKQFTSLGNGFITCAERLDTNAMRGHAQKVGELCTRYAAQGTWPQIQEWLSAQIEINGARECAANDLAIARSGYGPVFNRVAYDASEKTMSAMRMAPFMLDDGLLEAYWRCARSRWLIVLVFFVVPAILIPLGMIWYSLVAAGITALICAVVLSVYGVLFYKRYVAHRDEFQSLLDEAAREYGDLIGSTVIPAG